MYSVSVIPTATVPRVGKNQVITPPPAAPPLLAPVTYCPSISMTRVSVVMVGAHIIAPTARCPSFLSSPLESCTRPLPAVAVSRRWYHGDFVDAEPVGVSSSSGPDISSSSLLVQHFHCSLTGYFDRSSRSAKCLPDDALASTCYEWPVPASSLTRRSQVVVFIRLW